MSKPQIAIRIPPYLLAEFNKYVEKVSPYALALAEIAGVEK